MTEFVTDKATIVRAVLAQWENQGYAQHVIDTYDLYSFGWWTNVRKSGGLGLTYNGYMGFELAKLESYDFEVNIKKLGIVRSALYAAHLNRNLKCPHYLYKNENSQMMVKIYDSRIAMMIGLYGSLEIFLEKQNRKE